MKYDNAVGVYVNSTQIIKLHMVRTDTHTINNLLAYMNCCKQSENFHSLKCTQWAQTTTAA